MRSALILLGLGLLAGCGGVAQLEVVSDDCLEDEAKVYPGECGCGVPEERCVPLKAALVHRYAFDGIGAVAVDDVGGPEGDGSIVNGELTGSGQLHLLREGLGQYVNLPNNIVSELDSATFEAWLVWDTPGPDQFWERIFDFGVSTNGEDLRGDGESYLFLAPAAFRTAYLNPGIAAEIRADSTTTPFPRDSLVHVAVVVDATLQQLVVFLNTEEVARAVLDQPLSAIRDVNNWLGRSQFEADSRFGGTFLEFRIYDAALSQQQLRDSRILGDSPAFLQHKPLPGVVTQIEP